MKLFKKAAMLIYVLSVLLLNGCEASESIGNLDRADISYLMDTEIPCVNAEELYERKRYDAPQALIKQYGFPSGFDGKNLYVLRDNTPVSEHANNTYPSGFHSGLIAYYDIDKGEFITLYEEKSNNYIYYNYAGVFDSCLYYYRGEEELNDNEKLTYKLYRISFYSKQPEEIFEFNTAHFSSVSGLTPFVNYKKYLFFHDMIKREDSENNTEQKYTDIIYRYNTQNGTFEKLLENAKFPMEYKNGIAYLTEKNDEDKYNITYLDLEKNSEEEIGEINYSEFGNRVFSNKNNIFFLSKSQDSESGRYITEIKNADKNGCQLFGRVVNNSNINTTDGELMLLIGSDNGYMIYDERHNCLSQLNINRQYNVGYASDDSVMFFCYDNEIKNAILYIYSPKDES